LNAKSDENDIPNEPSHHMAIKKQVLYGFISIAKTIFGTTYQRLLTKLSFVRITLFVNTKGKS
jgi:hypothetical protein